MIVSQAKSFGLGKVLASGGGGGVSVGTSVGGSDVLGSDVGGTTVGGSEVSEGTVAPCRDDTGLGVGGGGVDINRQASRVSGRNTNKMRFIFEPICSRLYLQSQRRLHPRCLQQRPCCWSTVAYAPQLHRADRIQ